MAALLIARQIIGNLKESAIPYLIEQLRLARMSFKLFGALSPTDTKESLVKESEDHQISPNDDTDEKERKELRKGKQPRNVCQAELESSLYRVGHPTNTLLSDFAFKV